MIIECILCKQTFGGGNRAKYCLKCKTKVCKQCGNSFIVKYGYITKVKFCHISCATKYYLKNHPNHQKNIKRNYGIKHPGWKGGKSIHTGGYVVVLIAPKKYRFEHRIIMEKFLGRLLMRKEHVHHKNHIKTDNRIENLILFSNPSEHALYHVSENGFAHS